ncbi:structural constituent of ribosome [Raphanus sativus]|uniref:Uncharacterized protein LOC108809636 n=1 Tax=Raphanus sativus TaxID=3726 RepID=A0A6J0JNW9_RAPSA|nr:uncharacterized protein LOC108809636 [Raphanus sativus]KAJ4889623.1 structural constituent of ribosome [Raphanus sativus]
MASCSSDQSLSNQTSSFLTSSMLSRTSSSSSAVGDYLGTESCFDVLSADEENDFVSSSSESMSRYRYGGRRRKEREAGAAAAAREFPPPIPLLAQTENLLPHMPWVLKRVVTSDGRLILREEKVRHHDYFRAHRSNGRLTLHLVPLDGDVFELPQEPSHYQSDDDNDYDHEDDENECDDHHHDVGDDLDDLADNVDKSITITAPEDEDGVIHNFDNDKGNVHGGSEDGYKKAIVAAVADETVVESGGGGSPRGKCLRSCFVGMIVREIRPVLS